MHRFVFACLVLALMAQGVEGQTVSSEQDYASDVTQNNNVFRIVVIGDSIAWGAGLENDQKYYSLVRDWIAEEKNIPIRSIKVQVLAHTGATLYTETPDPVRPSDLSSGNPTIAQQASTILDPNYADLILISGGINDVGVDDIIKLDHVEGPIDNVKSRLKDGTCSIAEIRERSDNIREPMHALLNKLLINCPNAKIVVTSYYPIISDDSRGLTETISALYPESQKVGDYQKMDEPHQRDQLRDKSNVFYDESTESLREAVNDANADSGDNRVAFAQIEFSPENCYGTDQSLLWKIGNFGGQIRTDDKMFDTRRSILNDLGWVCACEQCFTPPGAEITQNVDCDLYRKNKFVAVGHPNEKGSIKYRDAIIKTIRNTWPEWPDQQNPTVLTFNVSPRSLTSGESLEITCTVSDNSGSGLKQVELWRKDESSDWQQISTNVFAGETGPLSSSFTDLPPAPGKYWYGIHVVDFAGNWNDERNSNTKNLPGIQGPIEVFVEDVKSRAIPGGEIHSYNVTILNSAGTNVASAMVVIDGTSNYTTDSHGNLIILLPDGSHTLNASKPGYGTGNWSGFINSTQNTSLNITLKPPEKHLFTITTLNSAYIPMADTKVWVDGTEKGCSGPDGNLSIELVNGNYAIHANSSGYGSGDWTGILDNRTNSVAIVVLIGPLEYPFDIITLNSAGYPMEGTNISIDGLVRGLTDQNGKITAMLEGGSHGIEAIKADYGSKNWTGVLDYNTSHEVRINLDGPLEYPFNITVINAANYSIEGAMISLGGVKKGVTNKFGFLKAFLPEGNQIILAVKDGYGSTNWSGELNHTDGNDIEIKIDGALEYPFNVTVTNSAGNIIQGANVAADGRIIGFTDVDGSLRAMLIDGNHSIEANKAEYIPGNWTGWLNHSLKTSIPIVLEGSSLIEDMRPIDLCLVLDTSGSMADQECKDLYKIQAVKDAAQDTIASFFFPGTSNRVAIVSFCHYPATVQEFTNNYLQAYENVSYLSAGGATSFGTGLAQAIEEFRKLNQTNHVREIIFMSDGMHNTPPDYSYYLALCRIMGIRVYTVGYGAEADHDLLKQMAALSGGEYVFADPCGNNESGIRHMFMRQQMNLSGSVPTIVASGEVAQGQTVNATSFKVLPGSKYPDITLIYPGSHLNVSLVGPDGKVSGPNEYVYVDHGRVVAVRLKDPKPGNWTVQVFGDQVNGTEPYTVYVSPEYIAPTIPDLSIKSIVVKETSGEMLKEQPVQISFNAKNFPTNAKADGSDINVFDQNGREIPRWIEEWDADGKKGSIWVKLPEIPAEGEIKLMLLTGNPGVPAENNGSNIFDFFDEFSSSEINTDLWSSNNSSLATIAQSNGTLHIYADERSNSSADLFSRETFKPNVTLRFRANVSGGQGSDYKGMGFLRGNVGHDKEGLQEGVYWLGEEKNLFIRHKYSAIGSSRLISDYKPFKSKYEAEYRTFQIKWLDSSIEYQLDGKSLSSEKSGIPEEAINIGFSLNTSYQAYPSEIFLDWILAYSPAVTGPKVSVETD